MKPIRLAKNPEARDRARELRKNMSVSEQRFWEVVRRDELGFRVRRQVPIGPYILDFYIPSAKVCVEIDGEQHENRRAFDASRDAYLEERGIATLRIPSLDLFEPNDILITKWVYSVKRLCEARTLHPPTPSSRKRKEGE
ncbi:MAG TPA: DUF559 domain-containing protein [Fimbriimonadaceae bacterium]|nr:DUF559 domain-containing protein [Fimbriimonadaceae bacterium]HRJ95539.1 DUF559 domain-containing protein [Fimbriimonadaceae bacterium]